MSDARLLLRPADDATLAYVESLLAENGLPSRDVRDRPDCFHVAYHDDERVGVGGLEVHGRAGLLRSVAVEESARGRGFGAAICERLETRARDRGVDRLYLLTTTAADFFARRGYETVERSDAPAAIRETTEFDDLCPASATCLRTSLSR